MSLSALPPDSTPSADVLCELLVSSRRRILLARLRSRTRPMPVAEAAREVVIAEHDAAFTEIPDEEVESALIMLRHLHVPKLVDFGFVEYDDERNAITLTQRGERAVAAVEESIAA